MLLTAAFAAESLKFSSSELIPSGCPRGPSSLIWFVKFVINFTYNGASAAEAQFRVNLSGWMPDVTSIFRVAQAVTMAS